MSGRLILAEIYTELTADLCLPALLDPVGQHVTHGGTLCDQPTTGHDAFPVRRFEQGEPGDFTKAVVAFGALSRGTVLIGAPRGLEAWTFRVHGWARPNLVHDGMSTVGDLHLEDIRDAVVRILAWTETRLSCGGDLLVLRKEHDGTVLPTSFDDAKAVWQFQEQFRWQVMSRAVRAPVEHCPCP